MILFSTSFSLGQNRPLVTGPHSFCGNPASSTYTIANFSAGSTFTVSVFPNSSVTNPNQSISTNTFTLNWNPSPVPGTIIVIQFNGANPINDTIIMQSCCSITGNPTTADDANFINLPGIQVSGNSYLFEGGVNGAPSVLGIHGELTTPNNVGAYTFKNCTLLMGSGARIAPLNTTFSNAHLYFENVTVLQGCDSRWEGIISNSPNSTTGVHFINSSFQNAHTLVNAKLNTIIDLQSNVNVLKCGYTFYSPAKATSNTIDIYGSGSGNKQLIIDGAAVMTAVYPSFVPIPINVFPVAAMLFADANVNQSTCKIDIQNINSGIIGIRSNMSFIEEMHFTNVNATGGNGSYTNLAGFGGVAISAIGNNAVAKSLKVGNTGSTSTVDVSFLNCFAGIRATTNMNLDVKNCTFNVLPPGGYHQLAVYADLCNNRNLTIENNTINHYDRGVFINSAVKSFVNINYNAITDLGYIPLSATTNPASPGFGNTAIIVSGKGKQEMRLHIDNNIITGCRNGIYLNSLTNSTLTLPQLLHSISNNVITLNTAAANVNAGRMHNGIWVDNCEYSKIVNNTIQWCAAGCTTQYNGTNSHMRGINLKQLCSVYVINNTITNVGQSMRMVSSCNFTQLRCNTMNNNAEGIYLDVASLTDQGAVNDAWDNQWMNMPGPMLRVLGTITNAFTWWHNTGVNYLLNLTNTSVGPSGSMILTPTTSNNPCVVPGNNDGEKYEKIVDDEIIYESYEEESRYMDKDFAYRMFFTDEPLRTSLTKYENYYAAENSGNLEKFRETDELLARGSYTSARDKVNAIIDDNNIEYNLKYTTYVAAQHEIDENDTYTQSEIDELTGIGFTDAWRGGEGVFFARGMLGIEVDDQENHLRIGGTEDDVSNSLIYPNPVKDFIYIPIEFLEISITDLMGRNVSNFINKYGRINLNFLTSGSYLLIGETIEGKKLIKSFVKY
jgi:Right handed beta helix region/Secretion system C-terminal sorting domain